MNPQSLPYLLTACLVMVLPLHAKEESHSPSAHEQKPAGDLHPKATEAAPAEDHGQTDKHGEPDHQGQQHEKPAEPATTAQHNKVEPHASQPEAHSSRPADEESPDEIARSLLTMAAKMFERKDIDSAETAYIEALNSNANDSLMQETLIQYANFLQKTDRGTRAVAVYEKFLSTYPNTNQAAFVLVELGRTLRAMGAFELALSRFYSVLNSTLAVDPENIKRYRDLSQLAKFEIAETYYQQGNFTAAGKFFGRIKLLDLPASDRARAEFREAYAFFLDGKLDQAVAALQTFLGRNPKHPSAQEGRYLLCVALRRLGHTQEALKQTLTLLQTAQDQSGTDKETWSYWQRRTGNQLANDFYEQGDFTSALTIYQTLSELNSDPSWRWPALYQTGLCYERLHQSQRAAKAYKSIIDEYASAEKAGNAPSVANTELREMAAWRFDQIDWSGGIDNKVRSFLAQQQPRSATPELNGLPSPAAGHK
jgi:tetratricopeptide (TPR) repeat protein